MKNAHPYTHNEFTNHCSQLHPQDVPLTPDTSQRPHKVFCVVLYDTAPPSKIPERRKIWQKQPLSESGPDPEGPVVQNTRTKKRASNLGDPEIFVQNCQTDQRFFVGTLKCTNAQTEAHFECSTTLCEF